MSRLIESASHAGDQSGGAQAGVVLNPATPVSAVEEALQFVDYVLVMSVNPGFGGQAFIPQSLDNVNGCATVERHVERAYRDRRRC